MDRPAETDARTPLPWQDRPAAAPAVSARSEQDERSLRALARRIPPRDAGAHNNLGVVYYQKGLIAEAAEQFELALELDPRMQVAERNLNIVYFGAGWFDERLRELHVRIEADPGDIEARRLLARTCLYGGDALTAIRELHRAADQRPGDPSILRQLARAELRRGDGDAAMRTLRYAASIAPDDAETHLRMGEVLYHLGLTAEARTALERVIGLDDTRAEAHHYLAFVCGELGDVQRATAHGARAQALDPGLSRAQRNLSLDGFNTARYEEMLGARALIPIDTGGEGSLTHYALALALRQKGLFEDAQRELDRARERGEDAFLVEQAEAELALLSGGSAAAVSRYEDLIEQEPASPKLWNELGVARHQLGQLEEAARAYQRALDLDPAYKLAWNNLGIVRHHRGEDDAQEAFEHALREGRAPAEVARNLGWLWHRLGAPARAEVSYRRALAQNPALATAWTGLGMLYLESGRIGDARRTLAQAVEADPLLPEARYHYAFALSADGDYPGALRETSRALELNPYITTPRFRLLIDLQFENVSLPAPDLDAAEHVAPGEAVESFTFAPGALDAILVEESLAEASDATGDDRQTSVPASLEALAAARVALEGGQFADADAHTRRAAQLGASPADVALLQGEIFLASGAVGESIDRFAMVLDALEAGAGDSSFARDAEWRSRSGLTRALLEIGRAGEALRHARALRERDPAEPESVILLAAALEANGRPGDGIAVLEAAVSTRPAHAELLTRLGDALLRAGDIERAESVLRQALSSDGDAPAARAVLARVLELADRPDEAVAQYAAALNAIPSFAEAAFGLADLAFGRGDVAEAISVLAAFLDVDPYNLGGLVRLGDMLWIAGRERQASVAYQRVLRFDPRYAEALEGLERLTTGPVEQLVDAEPWTAGV
ncbi:MAG: tetratricopeptide repeat protein [Gemmatimonadetes bacterium]|nr:tetratricopeptide repeat protein [Gemmatimonadota bacterium]